jgi:translation initiation factor IF-3
LEDFSISVKKSNDKYRVNEEILKRREVKTVLLIDEDGERQGEVPVLDALHKAKNLGLSLVEISPNGNPPVCRIMDYGKFTYDFKKKQAVAKKKQRQVELKEVKFRPTTDDGDFNVKLRSMTRFLEEGNKVKVTIRFRGREIVHNELGRELLLRVENALKGLGVVEQQSKMEGRQMFMMIAPAKKLIVPAKAEESTDSPSAE